MERIPVVLDGYVATAAAALKAAPQAAVQWEPHISGAGAERLQRRVPVRLGWQCGITHPSSRHVMACTQFLQLCT